MAFKRTSRYIYIFSGISLSFRILWKAIACGLHTLNPSNGKEIALNAVQCPHKVGLYFLVKTRSLA
ncbi:hypothetical protein [Funiculus sociatus]|uniref:hypothetical protein n=1 Tax=Funiculus sociatus TaxID=450527 RepID=UPI001687030A|nr:hypothetical protein [Trichocoleus sp. FACHB-69]